MHDHNFTHNDLKWRNLLIDDQQTLYLIDCPNGDFWRGFWLKYRITKDFPNLPAWIVKGVGGSTVHWSGVALRFQEHDFHTRTTYGAIEGANVLDWPITLAELERQAILRCAHACKGQVSQMAQHLGISRTTLWRRLKLLEIDPADYHG